ncbi:MAG: EAL domain-containing protein [Rhodoferax sp.]|nr:EAL domain-containing protein [Rhodoferax sp.]
MKALDHEIEMLRKRAEAALSHVPHTATSDSDAMLDAVRLVEELRVYQTELEIQNQDLKTAQIQTEAVMRKYRRMFEHLPLEGVIVDSQGFIVEANAVARKRFNLHRHVALQRRSVYQLFAFASRSNLYAALSHGLHEATVTQCQLLADNSGNTADADAHIMTLDPASLVDDERMLVLVDRTVERQLAIKHEEVRRSEARYRALFDGSKVPMLLIHPSTGTIVRGNEAALHFYGYEEAQFQKLCMSDISCHTTEETLAEMQQVKLEQQGHFFLSHRMSSGRAVPVEVHSGPIEIDGLTLLFSIVQDISERVRAQAAALESERILRTSIEAIDEAFVLYDPLDQLVYCNEKYKTLYDTSADLIVPGVTFEHLIRVGAERGQYLDAMGRIDDWVAERMAAHRSGNITVTQRIDSGQVLRILERRTVDGYTVGFRVDVTEIAQATESALLANQNYHNLLTAASEVSIIATDIDGVIQLFNRGAERMLGYSAAEVVGKTTAAALHLDSEVAQRAKQLQQELGYPINGVKVFTAKADREGQEHHEWTCVRKNGEQIFVSLVVTAVRSAKGEITGYLGISQDITQRKLAQASMQLNANVFTYAREGILIADQDANIIDVNAAFSRITGYERAETIGKNPKFLKSGRQGIDFYQGMWQSLSHHGHWEGEIWNRRKNGEVYAELLSISAIHDSEKRVVNYVALMTDISLQKAHERELEHIARYDALTGLPNRALLGDRLQQEMAHCLRRHTQLAVVFIDMDGFKQVNDLHGHDIGDELLIVLAHRMKAALREGDTLSRIGGDEFVAVLTGMEQAKDCEVVLSRLLAAAAEPVLAFSSVLQVSASIGVTLYPQDAASADQLLRHADHAMYQAKQAGKNRYHYFDIKDDAEIKSHRESLDEISLALDHEAMVLHYQPKVNMKTGRVVGMEALVRWQHPTLGILLPSQFLPTIKGHPLSIKLGNWVIRNAVRQLSEWNDAGLNFSVSVNIDALHLQQNTFVAKLSQTLGLYPNVQPNQLDLEVLETSAMDDIQRVTDIMRECCALGVGFSLDDFGTGYSSLTYLKRLPADLMKIDQSFVMGMVQDSDDFVIVEGVVSLARAFGRNVIAEGVETVSHGELLLALGCELGQGWGIARAMPAHEVPAWARAWQPDASWSAWNQAPLEDSYRDLVLADIKHRHWLRDIENYVTGKSETTPPFSVRQCPLGHWIGANVSARSAHPREFDTMRQAHERVHEVARDLVRLFLANENTEVRAILPTLNPLRDELIAAVRLLVSPPPTMRIPEQSIA